MISFGRKPQLSVIVVFHNMPREAARTLLTLSPAWQQGARASDYEVIAVDSNSHQTAGMAPLANSGVAVRHLEVRPNNPSPAAAVQAGLASARADHVAVLIDGARMLSPRLIAMTLRAFAWHPSSFIYTLGFHLGPKPQDQSMLEGYDQVVEDALLEECNWQEDGDALFDVSCLAHSSRHGYLGTIYESNFLAFPKVASRRLPLFDTGFTTPGGGLINLDAFALLSEDTRYQPTLIVGEGTFHQFHGGVATNTPADQRPIGDFHQEYQSLRGKPYTLKYPTPQLLGLAHARCRKFLGPF